MLCETATFFVRNRQPLVLKQLNVEPTFWDVGLLQKVTSSASSSLVHSACETEQVHNWPCSSQNLFFFFFFFHWHYSPLWALACRTIAFHFSLSVSNSPHHLLNLSSFSFFSTFVTISFLLCGVVSPTPNPQPGEPGYPFLSGSSPLTCLAWEVLPVAYATTSIALGIM
jgi:hypothetical protein